MMTAPAERAVRWCATMRLAMMLAVMACATDGRGKSATQNDGTGGSSAQVSVRSDQVGAHVRSNVEDHPAFQQPKRAACPRRIPDRHEERRRYPAIDVLNGLGYVTISSDQSRGTYDQVIELTPAGARELGGDLSHEGERYVITIAWREYVPGSERVTPSPTNADEVVAHFRWRWKPANPLGERLDLRARSSERVEHQGRARYVRSGTGWELREVWLESDGRDYLRS